MAKDQTDAARLMKYSLTFSHPLVIRYPNFCTEYKKITSLDEFDTDCKWEILKKSSSGITLISVGPKVNEFLDENINLIYPLWLNPIDMDMLKEYLNSKVIIIHDAYSTENGFASKVKCALFDLGYKGNIIVKAISNSFIKCASIEEQEIDEGVSTSQIKELIKTQK